MSRKRILVLASLHLLASAGPPDGHPVPAGALNWKGEQRRAAPGRCVCQWGMSTQADFSQRFAEDRIGHVETFAGMIGVERSKELALSLEKEEEE